MERTTKTTMTDRDVTKGRIWREIEKHFHNLHSPAFGKISGGSDLAASPFGKKIAFTGTIWHKLEGTPQSRVCIVDATTGAVELITDGRHSDIFPRWSPNGHSVAFLSDRLEKGVFQLYLLEIKGASKIEPISAVEGSVEYFSWSPTGQHILFGVADRGSDKRTGEGSGNVPEKKPNCRLGHLQYRKMFQSGQISLGVRPGYMIWSKRLVSKLADEK